MKYEEARKLYGILTFAEDALILQYTEIPLYAVRLLLFLYASDAKAENTTTETIKHHFEFIDSKINRIMHGFMSDYIEVHTIKVETCKRPINRYVLSRKGNLYVEQLIKKVSESGVVL